jgi:hypothetical protein
LTKAAKPHKVIACWRIIALKKIVYEEQTYREMPESMAITDSDDAWHPLKNPNYIEWWYFDVMNADGAIVRGQFYLSGNISRPRRVRVGVRASYLSPDGTEIVIDDKFPYSSFKASMETCDVKIDRNFIKGNLSHYELHIESSGKILDLTFDSEVKGFTSHAGFGDEKRFMYWVVPQPRGVAKGALVTKGKTFDIKGVGYRDHNWLNFTPLGLIAYWDWGRILDKEYTIIFADIVTTKSLGGAVIKPLLIYDSKKLIYMTTASGNWDLVKNDLKLDTETGVMLPGTHLLRARDKDLSLEVDLRLEKVFQKIDPLADLNPMVRWLIRTFKAKPSITSFFSVGSGKFSFAGQDKALACTAVHEFVSNL